MNEFQKKTPRPGRLERANERMKQGPRIQVIAKLAALAAQAASQAILLFLTPVLKLNPSPPKLMVTRKKYWKKNDSQTLSVLFELS